MKTKTIWIWTFEYTNRLGNYVTDWEALPSRKLARMFKKEIFNYREYFNPHTKFRNWKLHKVVLRWFARI